jgi:hypothetical protein
MRNWFVVLAALVVVFPVCAFAQALGVTTDPVSGTYAYPTTGSLTFSATATGGTSPYTYKWAKNGTDSYITDATTSVYTKSNLQSDDAGDYYAEVTDDAAAVVTSDPIVVTITLPPTVSTVPTTGTHSYVAGSFFTFTMTASSGATPYAYQWAKGGTVTGNYITDATTTVLTLSSLTTANAGSYYGIVTDDDSMVAVSGAIVVSITTAVVIPADYSTPTGVALDSGTTPVYATTAYAITGAKKNTFLYTEVVGDPIILELTWNESTTVKKKIKLQPYQIKISAGMWVLGPFPKELINSDNEISFIKTSLGTDTTVVKPFGTD